MLTVSEMTNLYQCLLTPTVTWEIHHFNADHAFSPERTALDYNMFFLNCQHFAQNALKTFEELGWGDASREGTLFSPIAFQTWLEEAIKKGPPGPRELLAQLAKSYNRTRRLPKGRLLIDVSRRNCSLSY